MQEKIVTVFGGSGFIGSSLIMRLAKQGYRVRVAVRNTDRANHLRVYGDVGQIMPIQVKLSDKQAIQDVIKGSWGVVNLLGILFEKGSSTFDAVHVVAPKDIANACAKENVKRLVHISAIGANAKSKSEYAKSKAKGEKAVLKAFPDATILRPSVVFGPGDNFLNMFAKLSKVLPIMAVFEKGSVKMQPVYVADVADAIMAVLEGKKTTKNQGGQTASKKGAALKAEGKTYELGGPEIYTLKELMAFAAKSAGRDPAFFNVPSPLGKMMAYGFEFLPTPLITRDQIKLLKIDNVVSNKAKGLKDIGIDPAHLEVIAPTYLKCYQKQF